MTEKVRRYCMLNFDNMAGTIMQFCSLSWCGTSTRIDRAAGRSDAVVVQYIAPPRC